MSLRLEAIKFNHDPSSATFDAFNIRKNESEFIEPPEWRRGRNLTPEDSPAAYGLFETRGNTLTIQASFSCDNPSVNSVDIRALDGRLYPKPVDDLLGFSLIADLVRPFLHDSARNILGEVEARNIRLSGGTATFKTFNLENVRIWDTGVRVQDIVWRWQYRIPPYGAWTDFARTTHRIYTTLDRPHAPWQQKPFDSSNLQLPWTAVLEYACRWAAKAQNPTSAAKRITHAVYQLGKDGIAGYRQSSQYTIPNLGIFKCAAFLFALKLGSLKVNCTDCATIVSTFANILGSDLWQSEFGGTFDYNPIIRIGESKWRRSFFNFHAVAWEEDCDVHNDVFDACLQIDGDKDPTHEDPDHVALLPTDLRFGGRANAKLYRDRLVASTSSPNAAMPEPHRRRRRFIQARPVSERPVPEKPTISQQQLDFTAEHFNFNFVDWALAPATDGLFAPDPTLPTIVPDGWTALRSEQLRTDNGVISESLYRSSTGNADALLLVTLYAAYTTQAAREWLHHSIAAMHSFEGVEKEQFDGADLFFVVGDECGITFSSRNVVVSLVNVGNASLPLHAISHDLLQKLASV